MLVFTLMSVFKTYTSQKCFQVAGNQIEKNVSPVQYLHFVWSLVLLNRATEEQIASVLCDEFISKLVASKESGKCKIFYKSTLKKVKE